MEGDPFEEFSFEEAIKPEHWKDLGATLHTPTFQAHLEADGTLFLSGVALQEGFSVEAVQALTRFLSERVTLPPLPPPADLSDFVPRRVDE